MITTISVVTERSSVVAVLLFLGITTPLCRLPGTFGKRTTHTGRLQNRGRTTPSTPFFAGDAVVNSPKNTSGRNVSAPVIPRFASFRAERSSVLGLTVRSGTENRNAPPAKTRSTLNTATPLRTTMSGTVLAGNNVETTAVLGPEARVFTVETAVGTEIDVVDLADSTSTVDLTAVLDEEIPSVLGFSVNETAFDP